MSRRCPTGDNAPPKNYFKDFSSSISPLYCLFSKLHSFYRAIACGKRLLVDIKIITSTVFLRNICF